MTRRKSSKKEFVRVQFSTRHAVNVNTSAVAQQIYLHQKSSITSDWIAGRGRVGQNLS